MRKAALGRTSEGRSETRHSEGWALPCRGHRKQMARNRLVAHCRKRRGVSLKCEGHEEGQ